MTVKKDETRLDITKFKYDILLGSWSELNHRYNGLLQVNGLVLSAIVICMGFVIESTTDLPIIPGAPPINPVELMLLIFLSALFASLSCMVISISKIIGFKISKPYNPRIHESTNFKMPASNIDTIHEKSKIVLPLTDAYEKAYDDLDDKFNELDKNRLTCMKILGYGLIFLFASLVTIILSKISALEDYASIWGVIFTIQALLNILSSYLFN